MISFNEWLYKNKVNEYMTDFSSLEKNIKPKTGDKAYTKYNGKESEGILKIIDPIRGLAKLVSSTPWDRFGENELSVGRDAPIQWDAAKNMWYAPVDD